MQRIHWNQNIFFRIVANNMFGIHKVRPGLKGSGTEGERFYLRFLLANVVGPSSFDDLLPIDNQLCTTFHEAALKLGLVDHDSLVTKCLDEAVEVQMPHALRRLFATVLIVLEPTNPVQLWNRYFNQLFEDFAHTHSN